MALLLERNALGRADDIVAPDLSKKIEEVQQAQIHKGGDGSFDVAQARAWLDEFAALACAQASISDIATLDEVIAGGIVIRRYNPGQPGPLTVLIHGGGWVIGSVDTHDHIARWLTRQAGGQVVSINYSLAPEHPYPTAINECVAVLTRIASEARQARQALFVTGDSAGANLAAMAILGLAPQARAAITGFISLYGAYSPVMNLSSHRLYADGRFGLSEAQMTWFWNLYAPHIPADQRDALTPLGADLSSFPPTLCIGAECDLLLDDTLAFYTKLAGACVDVSLSLWPSLPHGCMHFVGAVESVTRAANAIIVFIKEHMGKLPAPVEEPASAPAELGLAALVVGSACATAVGSGLVDIAPLFMQDRSRLHGSLAHRIASSIFSGELAPDTLLPREDLASSDYGVSRSAYREAIRTLAAKGLVDALPKVGTRILPRTSWRILDPEVLAWYFEAQGSEDFVRTLFELRKILEPSAAALSALRRTDEQLASMADHLSRMSRTGPRSGAWAKATIGFHEQLLAACGNEALVSLWPPIHTTLQWSLGLQMRLPVLQLEHDPVVDHVRVYEEIASRNAEGALREAAILVDTSLADTLSNLRRISTARSSA